MSEQRYDPQQIEPRWQAVWAERTWEVVQRTGATRGARPRRRARRRPSRRSSYVLEMLPYPSGEPHIGHLKVYSVGDAIAHFHRRRGHRVLHPMGYDAFGLPAENHAIKTGVHPRDSTAASIASFQRQFRSWGISIDWSRELATHEPRYYRWTQWIFLQLLRGRPRLPQGGGGQVVPERPDGARQRAGRSTAAASAAARSSRCASSSSGSSASPTTPSGCSTTSTGSTGPSTSRRCSATGSAAREGAEVTFRCEELGDRLPGVHDAPRHAVRRDLLRDGARASGRAAPRRGHRARAGGARVRQPRADRVRRGARRPPSKQKTGVPLGRTVTNPVNGERIPMFVADYVLMEYGTGAIMAVPGARRARLRVRARASGCRSAA